MAKFKFGPITYNCVDEEDDSGNYYWAGEPPVSYDRWGIPVDRHGKQTLPLDCPFHPFHKFESVVKSKVIPHISIPASTKCYFDWCDENFVVPDEILFKKDICKKAFKQVGIRMGVISEKQQAPLFRALKEEIMSLGNT